jgi:hypothetical protein
MRAVISAAVRATRDAGRWSSMTCRCELSIMDTRVERAGAAAAGPPASAVRAFNVLVIPRSRASD